MEKLYRENGNQKVGVFGMVKEVEEIATGKLKCLKQISKEKHDRQQLTQKMANLQRLKSLKSKLILKPDLIEEDAHSYYVVSDFVDGEELQKHVMKKKGMKESNAIEVLRGIVDILLEYRRLNLLFTYFKKRFTVRKNQNKRSEFPSEID